MTNERSRITARALVIAGAALLILNAADYLLGWDRISSAFSALGMILIVIGYSFAARAKASK